MLALGSQSSGGEGGTVLEWGSQVMPVVQPGTRFTAIAAGWGHNLALKSDGTVLAWGRNDYGQSAVPAGLRDVVAVSAGDAANLALKSDRTVVAWGDYDQSTLPSALCNVLAIAGGHLALIAPDDEPPVIRRVTASPDVLWPPNHTMRHVTIDVSAADDCHLARCKIISVTSNESIADHGNGHTPLDWQITGDLTLNLRAERSDTRTGRVYNITVECADNSGNTSTAVVPVAVAK